MDINNVYESEIIRQNNEGDGIAIIDNFIVFVKNALPSEIIKFKIDKIHKNYAEASIIKIIKKSKDRVEPLCPYYYECGGCSLMHQSYSSQLDFKKDKIKSILKKVSNTDIEIKNINSSNDFYYRNKVVLKVKDDKIGFFKSKTNEIVDIKKCVISNNQINDLIYKFRLFIKKYIDNNISEIMIKSYTNGTIISIDKINKNIEKDFIKYFEFIDSIYIDNKLVHGSKSVMQEQNNLKFNVSLNSFFQVNKQVSEILYNDILKNVKNTNTSLDLYCGTGTITMLLSKKSKNVIGIETVKDAVKDANENLKINKIKNVKFLCGKVEKQIENIKNEHIDYLIMDPPRSGSDKKTLKYILDLKPSNIIYVSCNPITLSRDLNDLMKIYDVKEINAYDMFPQTSHVETICVLKKM